MPELPEVEVVRAGVQRWATGREILDVHVYGDRALRRYGQGPSQFAMELRGRTLVSAQRRGKFLWLPIEGEDRALSVHLGMSGQLVLPPAAAPSEAHLRVRVDFADAGCALRFVDQRTFGWVTVEPLVAGVGGRTVARSAASIAPDPFESEFDLTAVLAAVRRSTRPVKAALLDQNVVSGIGNIYADEALWRARRHWATPCNRMTPAQWQTLLGHAREVMSEALAAGGTSFDSLYVNVNGESGYFSRELNVYGRQHKPCLRCGRPIVREAFANRSSYRCPTCQRRPRSAGAMSARA